MWPCLLVCFVRRSGAAPFPTDPVGSPASAAGGVVPGRPGGRVLRLLCFGVVDETATSCSGGDRSALALLVAQVLADHHDPAVTPDHLALVADLLDARLDLHRRSSGLSWPRTGAACSW